jgi:hypothetical protein
MTVTRVWVHSEVFLCGTVHVARVWLAAVRMHVCVTCSLAYAVCLHACVNAYRCHVCARVH